MGAGITGSILNSRVQFTAVTGHRGLASAIFSFQVEGLFAESQWRVPCRWLGVPVYSREKGKEREAPISEGCNRVWFHRSIQLEDCRGSEVSLLRPIPYQCSGVREEDNQQDCPQVFA